MSKNEKIKKLLECHRDELLRADTIISNGNAICFDGIVNESIFNNEKFKVAILLKDTNGNDNSGKLHEKLEEWNYREWLYNNLVKSDEWYGSTFNKLCMYVDLCKLIQEGKTPTYKEYVDLGRYAKDNFKKALERIAVVNLKKTWGRESCTWKILDTYLTNENGLAGEVVKNELDIISPNIVLCGGWESFEMAKRIFVKNTSEIAEYAFRSNDMVFIRLYHPAGRGDIEKYYNDAKEKFVALSGDILK